MEQGEQPSFHQPSYLLLSDHFKLDHPAWQPGYVAPQRQTQVAPLGSASRTVDVTGMAARFLEQQASASLQQMGFR